MHFPNTYKIFCTCKEYYLYILSQKLSFSISTVLLLPSTKVMSFITLCREQIQPGKKNVTLNSKWIFALYVLDSTVIQIYVHVYMYIYTLTYMCVCVCVCVCVSMCGCSCCCYCPVVKSYLMLWLLELQHARLPYTSIFPGVCSNSYPLNHLIQPCHPLSPSSPPAFNLSQHHGLFQWVSSLHQVAKVLELQLQHQSFQWIFRLDFF